MATVGVERAQMGSVPDDYYGCAGALRAYVSVVCARRMPCHAHCVASLVMDACRLSVWVGGGRACRGALSSGLGLVGCGVSGRGATRVGHAPCRAGPAGPTRETALKPPGGYARLTY